MTRRSKAVSAYARLIVLILLAPTCVGAQERAESTKVSFCDVVASPTQYDGQTLSVDAILWPTYHSLSLFGEGCVPKGGSNVTTQAILPDKWEARPNGRKLRGMLKHGRPARVELVGTFESRNGPYGPDGARFRFSIAQIESVSRAPKPRTGVVRGDGLTR